MERSRGALVDQCWRCGTWLRRASADQHAALQMALTDIALQQDWPPGSGKLSGPSVWWERMVNAFDRLKRGEAAGELEPAIDGIGFDGRGMDFVRGPRMRRQLNDHEISDIIEYVNSWAAARDIKRRHPEKAAA